MFGRILDMPLTRLHRNGFINYLVNFVILLFHNYILLLKFHSIQIDSRRLKNSTRAMWRSDFHLQTKIFVLNEKNKTKLETSLRVKGKLTSENFEKTLNTALGPKHLHLVHSSPALVPLREHLFAVIDTVIK